MLIPDRPLPRPAAEDGELPIPLSAGALFPHQFRKPNPAPVEATVAAIDTRYTPEDGDTIDTLLQKAHACGRDLAPEDARSAWIDDHAESKALTDEYHLGQSEQFEQGEW